MKKFIFDVSQVILALLMTGTLVAAMAPPPIQPVKTNLTSKAVSKPAKAVVVVKPITWQDNPNHCTDEQLISKDAPFSCTDKPVEQEPVAQTSAPVVSGGHEDWMKAAGIAPGDYEYVEYIVNRESGWNPNSVNASSGAEGLPQALPYSKTGCGHGDPICQLVWANSYAIGRYGSWCGAYNFWLNHSWW
jgi:hypothetical protein